jgi:hypothetical protein
MIARTLLVVSLISYGFMMAVVKLRLIGQPLILFWPIIASAVFIAGSTIACVTIQLAGLFRRQRPNGLN